MEKQSKLMEKNYLSARLNDFKEVKSKKVNYSFWIGDGNIAVRLINTKTNKSKVFKIVVKNSKNYDVTTDFVIEPDYTLDKSIKEKYINFLNSNIKEICR